MSIRDSVFTALGTTIAVLTLAVYGAAKLHTWTSMWSGIPLRDFVAAHWPYWAMLAFLAALLFAVGLAGRARKRSEKE